jgi:hypothetical protein
MMCSRWVPTVRGPSEQRQDLRLAFRQVELGLDVRIGPAEEGAHAGQELIGRKRLYQGVVAAAQQPGSTRKPDTKSTAAARRAPPAAAAAPCSRTGPAGGRRAGRGLNLGPRELASLSGASFRRRPG